MKIQYVLTGGQREVSEAAARRLIAMKVARPVEAAPAVQAVAASYTDRAMKAEEISPRTGKPKRQYKRRDMRAED